MIENQVTRLMTRVVINMKDTDLITHEDSAFNIFLIGEIFGLMLPVNEKQTAVFLNSIIEKIKMQQKQIKIAKEFKASFDNLRFL